MYEIDWANGIAKLQGTSYTIMVDSEGLYIMNNGKQYLTANNISI